MRRTAGLLAGLMAAAVISVPVQAHASPGPVNAIVVLGAQPGTSILDKRINKAASLSNRFPTAVIVVTGRGASKVPEAVYMKKRLVAKGIADWKIVTEARSYTTKENARNTVPILRRIRAGTAMIVTQRFHMKRALTDFRQADPTIRYTPSYARG